MKLRQFLVTSSVAVLILWAAGLVLSAPVGGKSKNSNGKEKHWSGNLVDANCMVRALSAVGVTFGGGGVSGPPWVSQFLPSTGGSAPQVQGSGPQTGPGGQTGGQTPSTSTPTGPGAPTSTGPSPEEQQQQARANQIDQAEKTCAATSSTQSFALATSGGKLVKFDQDGNTKAADALKAVDLQPGKKVKAKVTGTMEDPTTVKVASVEVKGGKRSKGSSGSAGR